MKYAEEALQAGIYYSFCAYSRHWNKWVQCICTAVRVAIPSTSSGNHLSWIARIQQNFRFTLPSIHCSQHTPAHYDYMDGTIFHSTVRLHVWARICICILSAINFGLNECAMCMRNSEFESFPIIYILLSLLLQNAQVVPTNGKWCALLFIIIVQHRSAGMSIELRYLHSGNRSHTEQTLCSQWINSIWLQIEMIPFEIQNLFTFAML